MQCVRCSQPLPARADRCLRCFALNPQNGIDPLAALPPAQIRGTPRAAAPTGLSFESDPPLHTLTLANNLGALSIHSEPPMASNALLALTLPALAATPLPALAPLPELAMQLSIPALPEMAPLEPVAAGSAVGAAQPVVAASTDVLPQIRRRARRTDPQFGKRVGELSTEAPELPAPHDPAQETRAGSLEAAPGADEPLAAPPETAMVAPVTEPLFGQPIARLGADTEPAFAEAPRTFVAANAITIERIETRDPVFTQEIDGVLVEARAPAAPARAEVLAAPLPREVRGAAADDAPIAPLLSEGPSLTPAAPDPLVSPAAPALIAPPPRRLDALAHEALLYSNPDVPFDSSRARLSLPPRPRDVARRAAADTEPPPLARAAGEPALAGQPWRSGISQRPPLAARCKAWALDGAAIGLTSAIFVALAALQLGPRQLAPLGHQSWQSWADGLLFSHRLPIFWAVLSAALAVGYSWLFAALGGRTPGLRAAGLQLQRIDGSPLDPVQALVRAALALPSAALALFGFVLALLDPRGQTLHDKLSRSLVVSDGSRAGSQ